MSQTSYLSENQNHYAFDLIFLSLMPLLHNNYATL